MPDRDHLENAKIGLKAVGVSVASCLMSTYGTAWLWHFGPEWMQVPLIVTFVIASCFSGLCAVFGFTLILKQE